MAYYTQHVFLCVNKKTDGKKCCANSGGEAFFYYMKSRLLELNLHGPGAVRISQSSCLGRCSMGPCMVIYPEGIWYAYSSFADIDEIIQAHLISGSRVQRLLLDKE